MTRTLLTSLLLLAGCITLTAQQTIFGTVKDELGDPIYGSNVKIFNGDSYLTGAATDFDGAYRINLDPGTYNVEFSYIGYTPRRIDGFTVIGGQENKLDMDFEDDGGIVLETAIVTGYKVDPMRVDETTQGQTLTSEDVKKLGTRNINAIASLTAGATSSDEGGEVSIRGGRTNATQYVIDGVRVTGVLPPESEIDQIQVVTGGVEAKYGDLSSGLINITTKGPSSRFNGYVDGETSRFLDAYNNNLVGVSLSGPILKKASEDGSETTLLGYRLSGRYTYNEDDDAPATDIFYITDQTRQELETNPITQFNGSPVLTAGGLGQDDVQVLDAQPFEALTRIDLTGKLDARLSDQIDVTLSGTYTNRENQFTPGETSRTQENWRLLNAHNNPFEYRDMIRGNFRFRQRLGNQNTSDTTSLISNALYTLQFGFQRELYRTEDQRHEDRFFDYGHIGNFDFNYIPVYDTTFVFDTNGVTPAVNHLGYRADFDGYSPSTANPVLANYNKLGFDGTEGIPFNDFIARNGLSSNILTDGVYGLHENIGEIYNLFNRSQNDIITFSLQTQFDLRPAKGKAGTHNIQLGVTYEQRINRDYNINPRNLWVTARNLSNSALQGIDSNSVASIDTLSIDVNGFPQDVVRTTFNSRFEETALGSDSRFYQAIRAQLGLTNTDYVNTDGLDPSELSLDLFSAVEATQNGAIDYYGYDYKGNLLTGNTAWEDFFTERDPVDGTRTFPVAPIQPIYFAGYLQDKFSFKNIILRAGVRVDYFDANTKVLKDPYELYDIQTVGDFAFSDDYTVPANVPSTAKVYTESPGGNVVKAFRDGDTWFTSTGRQVNQPNEIFTSTQNAAFVDDRANNTPVQSDDPTIIRGANFIRSTDFDPNASFRDYEAQINFMPRLAFSFPISDDANFFAHYDVLVQRPPSNTIATALDYYYWFDNISQAGAVVNNPNLLPTRTIDYEAGFQQRISASSALKMSFFVREMRDMIQRRTYFFAMGGTNTYTTYDNQDFGTIKGLNLSYDLRKTGPVSLRLGYALQFADGTGSDANSQSGSLNRGNLRTLYPLSFDERHNISGSIDYRYNRGEGPSIFGVKLLENTGINLFGSAISGRPYTREQQAIQLDGRVNEGDINGARLPWNLALNAKIERNFSFFNDNGRGVNMNVYLRVTNLLDRRNIINVYSATGLPDDDGFLASPNGQALSASQINQEAYVQSYQWRVLNPNFFSLPRRMFLGASFSF